MIAKNRNYRRVAASASCRAGVVVALWGVISLPLEAQDTVTNPAAASGMTSGLPGVSTARQAELMQVRARAQAARPEAERAAMERSAEDALAKKSQQQMIDEARAIREMKDQAARQLEHQKAAAAYRGVSSGEMNSWADDSGRVKVERGVPPEVLANLPPEEEEPLVEEEEGGFNPFKAPKKAMQGVARAAGGATGAVAGAAKKGVSLIPGLGKDDEVETGLTATPRSAEAAAAIEEDKPGMFSRLPLVGGRNRDAAEPSPTVSEPAPAGEEKKGFVRGLTSRIPFVGGGDEEAPTAEAPAPAPAPMVTSPNPYADPATAMAPATQPAATEEAAEGGFMKKLPLIGGKKPDEVPPTLGVVGPAAPAASDLPPAAEEKPGMLGGFKNLVGKVVPGGGNRSDGLASSSGPIDASLFPQENDPEKLMADPSAGGEKKKLFKLPDLPEVSMPSIPTIAAAEPKQPLPKKTFTPTSFVVSRDGAQFMRFGAGTLGSDAQTLRAGTMVTKTKHGDEWSTIQLADGSTGIIRNSDLGSGGGAPAAAPAPMAGPVGGGGLATASADRPARITSPVSATGAGISDVPGPPVSLPSSSLSGGGAIPPASTVVPPIP